MQWHKFNLFNLKKNDKFPSNPYLPNPLYPDDVFLVSYPKSGNTWVRFLIANIIKKNPEDIVDFHSIQKFVPEVIRNNEFIEQLERPRVIKSHGTYTDYPKVIYLVRDGRDVYVSYYFYRLNKFSEGITFHDFFKRQDHYPCLWGDHVKSWLFGKNNKPNILVIKYEDILHDCTEVLKRIINFIGLEVTEDEIIGAIEASRFENMRKLEKERGRPYKEKEKGPDIFMRQGKQGNWRDFFGIEERKVFKSREGELLIRLGYEENDNW
ncbi:MAG TPA: hypothetical protein DD379_04800 [Cyanobacteria bacterium UBA11162]|nr:hypothetical protein [Cyanobacteria bacterium UBA11162]